MPNSIVTWFRGNHPDLAAGLSDEDITMRYAAEADVLKANGGVDLFAEYPDFAEDYTRIRSNRVRETITVGDRAKQAYRSLAGGFVHGVGAVPETAAVLAKHATGGYVDVTGPVSRGVDAVAEFISPDVDPDKAAEMSGEILNTKLPGAIGSAASFMVGGGAVGKAGKAIGLTGRAERIAGTVGIAGLAAPGGFMSGYKDALANGASEADALKSGFLNGGVAVSEVVPLSRMLNRLSDVLPDGITPGAFVGRMLATAGRETVEEAIQEGFQSGAADVIARNLVAYDPDRELFKSLKEDAAVGGLAGFVMSMLTQGVQRAMSRVEASKTPDAPVAPELDPTKPIDPSRESADAAIGIAHEVNLRGVEDLLQRELAGEDVTGEVNALKEDDRRVYNLKRSRAMREKEEKAKAAEALADEEEPAEPAEPAVGPEETPAPAAASAVAPAVAATTAPAPAATATTTPAPAPAPAPTAAATTTPPVAATPTPAPAAAVTPAVPPALTTPETPAPPQAKTEAPVTPAVPAETTPAPAAAVAVPDISRIVQETSEKNNWLDSVEPLKAQAAEQKSKFDDLNNLRNIVGVIRSRLTTKGKDGLVPPQKIEPAELQALVSLNRDSTAATGIGELIAKIKAEQWSVRDLSRVFKLATSAGDAAMRRSDKSSARLERINKPGEKLTAADILDVDSINFGARSSFPGYYSASHDIAGAWTALREKYGKWASATSDAERDTAMRAIGDQLVDGGSTPNRSQTKRLSIWRHKDAKDVVVLSTYAPTGKHIKGANAAYRFYVGGKAKKLGSDRRGIKEMLDAGYIPIGSIQTESARGQVSIRFPDTEAFMKAIGNDAGATAQSIAENAARIESEISAEAMPVEFSKAADAGSVTESVSGDEAVSEAEKNDRALDVSTKSALQVLFIEYPALFEKIVYWGHASKLDQNRLIDEAMRQFTPELFTLLGQSGLDEGTIVGFLRNLELEIDKLFTDQVRSRVLKEAQYEQEASAGVDEVGRSDAGQPAGSPPGGGGGSQGGQGAPVGTEGQVGVVAKDAVEAGAGGPTPEASAGTSVVADPNHPFAAERKAARDQIILFRSTDGISEVDADSLLYAADRIESQGDVDDINEDLRMLVEQYAASQLGEESDNDSDDDGSSPVAEDEGGLIRQRRHIPETVDAVHHNISRYSRGPTPNPTSGLLMQVSLERLRSDNRTLKETLTNAAKFYASGNGSESSAYWSAIAKLLSENADALGVTFGIDEIPGDKVAGKFDVAASHITVNPKHHASLNTFYQTVLHEAFHAHLTRLISRWRTMPHTLDENERQIIDALYEIALVSRQKMPGLLPSVDAQKSPDGIVDEFIAYAMTEPKAIMDLSRIKVGPSILAKVKDIRPESSIWEAVVSAVKRYISNLIQRARDYFQDDSISAAKNNVPEVTSRLVTALIERSGDRLRTASDQLVSLTAAATRAKRVNTGWILPSGEAIEADSEPMNMDFGRTIRFGGHAKAALEWLEQNDPDGRDVVMSAVEAEFELSGGDDSTTYDHVVHQYMMSKGWARVVNDNFRLVVEGARLSRLQRSILKDTAIDMAIPFVWDNGRRAQTVWAPEESSGDIRYRKVDGFFNSSSADITPDASALAADARHEAMRMMATTNEVDATLNRMRAAWEAKGGNVAKAGGTRHHKAFVSSMVARLFRGKKATGDEIRRAINEALVAGGSPSISTNIMLSDLDPKGAGPKAVRDALYLLQRLQGKMAAEEHMISEEFGRKNLWNRIHESNQELMDVLRKYKDATVIAREFTKELRRGLKESADTGAKRYAEILGVSTPAPAVEAATKDILADVAKYTDALQALAETGLDFAQLKGRGGVPATLTAADVFAEVMSSVSPEITPLRSKAHLAVALQFARRRPLVMTMLAIRRKGPEATALSKIIEIAMSDRPDAFEEAVAQLGKLRVLGAMGQRILNELRAVKAENKELNARAEMYEEWLEFAAEARPVLDNDIRALERYLEIEGHTSGRQWEAVHGAEYFVPSSDSQPMESLFANAVANPSRKELQLGGGYDPVQVKSDIIAMKSWMKANPGLEDTPEFRLMARQVDRMTKLQGDAANWGIQRGPGGVVLRLFGDIATQADHLGLQSSREFARQLRMFQSHYESHLRTPDQKEFYEFDALEREATRAAGINSPEDFQRRIYDKAWAYLESRQDLLDPSLSEDAQTERSINEAVKYVSSIEPVMAKPGAVVALNRLMHKAIKCVNIVQAVRRDLGIKVREVKKDGRVIFREPIGHPAHTMSRILSEDVRSLVAGKMATKWSWDGTFKNANGVLTKSLSRSVVRDLYSANPAALDAVLATRFTPEVIDQFVRPLVTKTGKTNFKAPAKGDVQDMAGRSNLIHALNAAGNDMVRFAEILHGLEGGSPDTLEDFVGQTISTFYAYYMRLRRTVVAQSSTTDTGDVRGEHSTAIGRAFMDAREGEDYPAEWLSYRKFGYKDHIRYIRILATQAAFGSETKDVQANLRRSTAELEKLHSEYIEAMGAATIADRDRKLNEGGAAMRRARENAAKNLESLKRIEHNFRALYGTLRGAPQDERTLIQLVGAISGMAVQGIPTAFTDTISLIETPFRKFGFSKQALSFIFGTWKYYGYDALGTLFQAMGMEWHANARHRSMVKAVNLAGGTDLDAMSKSRGVRHFAERYREEMGAEMTFDAIRKRHKGQPTQLIGEVSKGAVRRLAVAAKIALQTGVGVATTKDAGYSSLKLLQPFSQNNVWMHRAVALKWLDTVNEVANAAAKYFKAHPVDANSPSFEFTPKTLGYSTRSLLGIRIDDRSFEYLKRTLNGVGITFEELGRRVANGESALTNLQTHSVVALAESEILFNSSVVTRPAWTMTSTVGRVSSPLVGWSLYKMADLVKTTRSPKGVAEARAFASALTAFALAVVPVSLAYAILRDEYEEEVLAKKQNVLPLKMDGTLPLAMLDNISRVGALGVAGDAANSIFNVSTAREFSIDSRVFFISSMLNMGKIAGQLVRQDGTATYQTIWRPFLQSVGGSGYLSNFDAINNVLALDNAERRVVRRIHVGNLLRAVGREADLDVRVTRGGATGMPDPVKPHVYQMVTAAYANDPIEFRRAYTAALTAARREAMENKTPDADPVADVAETFQRMHPLRTIFVKSPTTSEYQKLLRLLGDDSSEVSAAIRNFNTYGAQIPTGRGKPSGIKPFYGTDRKEPGLGGSSSAGGALGSASSLGGLGSGSVGSYRSIIASM